MSAGPGTGPPDCSTDGDTYPGSVFNPKAAEFHVPGDPLNVTWYVGKDGNVFNTSTSRYDFSILLQSFNQETNVTLLNRMYDVADVDTPRVKDFTQCDDLEIVEQPKIPFGLNITEILFNVIIVLNYAEDSIPSGWTVGSSATGATFTISPTNFQVGPTSTASPPTTTKTTTTTDSEGNPTTVPLGGGNGSGGGGLSTGAQAGIGVGVAVAAIVMGLIGWMVWHLRRKMARYEKAQNAAVSSENPDESSSASGAAETYYQQNYLSELGGPPVHEVHGDGVIATAMPLNDKREDGEGEYRNHRPVSEIDGKATSRPVSELDGWTWASPGASRQGEQLSPRSPVAPTISEMSEEEGQSNSNHDNAMRRNSLMHELP